MKRPVRIVQKLDLSQIRIDTGARRLNKGLITTLHLVPHDIKFPIIEPNLYFSQWSQHELVT